MLGPEKSNWKAIFASDVSSDSPTHKSKQNNAAGERSLMMDRMSLVDSLPATIMERQSKSIRNQV